MIYEGILGPHEGFQTLQKEPSDFLGYIPVSDGRCLPSSGSGSLDKASALQCVVVGRNLIS